MALLSPIFNETHFKSDGTLASGFKIYTYLADSDIAAITYTTEDGDVPQANPIILNSRGELDNPIWLSDGVKYKFIFTSNTDVVIKTIDNIVGVSAPDGMQDQWIEFVGTATYISGTSFSVDGDQTSIFDRGRALKLLTSAGTVYAYVSTSAFTTLTTITVAQATGLLDSGLTGTKPSYGVLSGLNNSLPDLTPFIDKEGADVVAAATTNIWSNDGNTRHVTGNTTITSFGTAPKAGARMRVIFDGTPLLTHSANLNLNAGTSNIQIEAGDYADVIADTTTQLDVIVYRKSGQAVTAPAGNVISQGNTNVTITDSGTGVIAETIDGVVREQRTAAARSSTIDGGTVLYPEFKCRAWVNFNGTGAVGANQTIFAGCNVSSVFKNATGDYTINFTTAMPDTNYLVIASTASNSASGMTRGFGIASSGDGSSPTTKTTTAVRVIRSDSTSLTLIDGANNSVAIFR